MFENVSLTLALIAAAGGLVLGALVVFRSRNQLSLPLALLALDQFAWNAATVGLLTSGAESWKWAGGTAAPLFIPFAFHFVIVFVGRRSSLQKWMYAAYFVFGLQGLSTAIAGLLPSLRDRLGLGFFSGALAATAIPTAFIGAGLVVMHLRKTRVPLERLRAGLLLLALALMTLLAGSELFADLGYAAPRLAHLGSFAFNGIMAVLAFRLGLLAPNSKTAATLASLLIILGGAGVALLSFLVLNGNPALFALMTGATTLILVVITWRFASAAAERRESLTRVANLGRFSAQMVHDLRNPIAAAQGALQFLQEEQKQGRPLEKNAHFLQLIADQLARVNTTVDRYQRLSRVEPSVSSVEVAALIDRVLSLQNFAATPGTALVKDLASALPLLRADADLLATALENLVKNAFEALPGSGGTVTVSASGYEDADGGGILLAVADTGSGMDARTRERAFEPYFTTKSAGTGLGLAWVREVARAHGGEATLESTEGQGTRVELRLPLGATPPSAA